MMKKTLAVFAIAAAALAGCATDQGMGARDGVSVTRFHLGQQIARAEIRVEPADPDAAGSLEFGQLAAPVERELARLGWTIARGNARSEQVAIVRLEQGARAASRGGGLSIGIGGGSFGRRSGVGVGVGTSIPLGSPGSIVVTELEVRIQRRSDATVAWEGRAQTEARAGAPLANPIAAADRLAVALFQDFPGESGTTIRVR
jgi:predicted small secreted protein